MNVTIRIDGVNRVNNKLRALAAQHPEVIERDMEEWSRDMRNLLKSTPYPSKRQNQRYVRTGQLANRWRVQKVKPGSYSLVNDARGQRGQLYAGYVVGDRGDQAWMHQGRWWIAAEVIRGYTADLTRRMTRSINRFWSS